MYDLQFSLTTCAWSQCLSGLTLFIFGVWSILLQHKNFISNYGVHLFTGFMYFLCGLALKFLSSTKSKRKIRICMVIQLLSSLMAFSSCATACYRTMRSEAFKELGSIIFYMSWMITSAVAFLMFSIGMSLCVIKEAHLAIHPFQLHDGFTFCSLRGVVNFQNRFVRTTDFLGNPPPYTRYPHVPLFSTTAASQSTQENSNFTPPPEMNETTH